mmetsp:Transcript_7404/g.18038  ORF Transcript_7404/g.18038 Transcript_7404/m.18038 type:complete len:204 (+) Transcript_7404:115-726(+)
MAYLVFGIACFLLVLATARLSGYYHYLEQNVLVGYFDRHGSNRMHIELYFPFHWVLFDALSPWTIFSRLHRDTLQTISLLLQHQYPPLMLTFQTDEMKPGCNVERKVRGSFSVRTDGIHPRVAREFGETSSTSPSAYRLEYQGMGMYIVNNAPSLEPQLWTGPPHRPLLYSRSRKNQVHLNDGRIRIFPLDRPVESGCTISKF